MYIGEEFEMKMDYYTRSHVSRLNRSQKTDHFAQEV